MHLGNKDFPVNLEIIQSNKNQESISLNEAIGRALRGGANFDDLVLVAYGNRERYTMTTDYGPLQVWPSPYASASHDAALFDRRALGLVPDIASVIECRFIP